MRTPALSNAIKKSLLRGVLAAALMATIGIFSTSVAATGSPQTWSVWVHIEYVDGFVYEAAVATGLSTSEMTSRLAECGHAHWYGSAVLYHCFPVLD